MSVEIVGIGGSQYAFISTELDRVSDPDAARKRAAGSVLDRAKKAWARERSTDQASRDFPPDAERWNPYPKWDEDDEDEDGDDLPSAYDVLTEGGWTSLTVTDPREEGPTAGQQAAMDWLSTNESQFVDLLVSTLKRHRKAYGDDEEFGSRWRVDSIDISRWDEPAKVVVSCEADWELEHGLYVVMADGRATAVSADELSEELAGDPVEAAEWEAKERDPAYHLYSQACDAAMDGDVEKLRELAAQGVDFNLHDDRSLSPLEYAINDGHVEAVEFLLSAGADPRLRNDDGLTALGVAREKFTELGWMERPPGCLPKLLMLFVRSKMDADGMDEEIENHKRVVHALERHMGMPLSKFRR